MHELPEIGYLRLPQIIGNAKAEPPIPAVIPVGKSTWWGGVKSGRFPKPVKLGPRITAWRVEDIRALIKQDVTLESLGNTKKKDHIEVTRSGDQEASAWPHKMAQTECCAPLWPMRRWDSQSSRAPREAKHR